MIIGLSVWIATTLLTGFVSVAVVWPAAERPRPSELLLRLTLSVGAGLGIGSCTMFAATAMFGPTRLPLLALDVVVLAAITWAARVRSRSASAVLPPPRRAPDRLEHFLVWVMLAVVGAGLLVTVALTLKARNGLWDAWGIYNLMARFMYLGGASWRAAFTPGLGLHPDYPLLLPTSVARGWLYAGRDTVIVPAVIAGLFTYATMGLLAAALWVLRGARHAALGGIVALGTPLILVQGASQYADMPLAFYMFATVVLVAVADRVPSNASWFLSAAGVAAAFAGWTKNEGLLYLLIISLGLLLVRGQLLRQRGERRALYAFFLGLIPVLAMIVAFKIALAPPNDLVSGQGSATLPRILNLARYKTIIFATVRALPTVPAIPLAVFTVLAGVDLHMPDRRAVGLTVFALFALAAGYFAVYVVTPLNLPVQLNRSLTRLLLQLWPLLLFAVFMVARVPEEASGTTAE